LAFPHNHDSPTEAAEGPEVFAVAGVVFLQLGHPVFSIGSGHSRFATAFVAVPEAAVYEDDASAEWKDNVWFSGQIFFVKPVAVSESVQ